MTTNSRLQFINIRQRKNLNSDAPLLVLPQQNKPTQAPKLILPDAVYQPTYPAVNSRTSMRLLKGKFDRNSSSDKGKVLEENQTIFKNVNQNPTNFRGKPEQHSKIEYNDFGNKPNLQSNINGQQNLNDTKTKMFRPPLPNHQAQQQGLKLVLPDQQPPIDLMKDKQKKTTLTSFNVNSNQSKQGFAKKILIEEPPVKQEKKKNIADKIQKIQPVQQPNSLQKQGSINALNGKRQKSEDRPIQLKKDQPKETPQIQNQNQLIQCPEGCGRKFNRKALQTHAKACKIVFMSKRKQFNSQAKRVTSKQQANLVKQAKQKQKKDMMSTKMQKTGQAWKTQSQGFRAVVKALKQQQGKIQQEQQGKAIVCEYCQKMFTQIIYEKHILICEVKKQREKQKQGKKGNKKGSKK